MDRDADLSNSDWEATIMDRNAGPSASDWEATAMDSLNDFVMVYLMRLEMFNVAQSFEYRTKGIGFTDKEFSSLDTWTKVHKFYHSHSLSQLFAMAESPNFPSLDLLNLNVLIIGYLKELGLTEEANVLEGNRVKDSFDFRPFHSIYGWVIAFTGATSTPALASIQEEINGIVERLSEPFKEQIDRIFNENFPLWEKLIVERFPSLFQSTEKNGESRVAAATDGKFVATASTSSTRKKKKKKKKKPSLATERLPPPDGDQESGFAATTATNEESAPTSSASAIPLLIPPPPPELQKQLEELSELDPSLIDQWFDSMTA